MQVPRDILLNRWTWLMVLTLLALGSLYQYTSSKQHQSARAIVETATTAEAAHVLQSLQRRLSDISEAISGTGTADNESSFKAAAQGGSWSVAQGEPVFAGDQPCGLCWCC